MSETVKPASRQEIKRDYALDVMRAIAAIYIIGFWHHVSYIELDVLKTPLTRAFAVIALGVFFTVSAYLLTLQQRGNMNRTLTSEERKDVVKTYFSKRVFRIYPLYVLAVLMFFALNIGRWTIPHLITSVTLTAALIDKSPLTLWFINVIFLYYLTMPILWFFAKTNIRIVSVGIITGLFLFLLHRYAPLIDERIYIYLPSMIFGVLLGKNEGMRESLATPFFYIGSALVTGAALFLIYAQFVELDYIIAIISVMAFPALIKASEYIGALKNVQKLWVLIGYASFAAYLFHRVFFEIAYDHGLGRSSDILVVSFGVIFILPAIFVASYFLQNMYDNQIGSFLSKFRSS